jgi:hypothetical protein
MKGIQSSQNKVGEKGMFVTLMLLLTFSALGNAQDHPEWYTDGHYNGRFWLLMGEGQKNSYVEGYYEGVSAAALSPCSDVVAAKKTQDALTTPTLTRREVVKALDAFYATPENGPILIINAMIYVGMKASGSSAQNLEKWTEEQRASVAH